MSKGKEEARVVVVDWGNEKGKLSLVNPDGSVVERIMPHGFIFLNDVEWANRQSRARNSAARLQDTQSFQILDRDGNGLFAVLVGEEAIHLHNNNRELGSNKYYYRYMASLICAAFLELFPIQLYPKGHDNIILGLGHPPSEIEHLDRLIDIVGGTHKIIDPLGNKRLFHVSRVITYDEPMGGFTWLQHRPVGNSKAKDYNPLSLSGGDEVLAIDIGGFIGSMCPLVVNNNGQLYPLFNDARAINQGIVHVNERIGDNLKSLYPEETRGMKIPDVWLRQALQTGEILVSGSKVLDAREAVTQSLSIIDEMERLYTTYYGRGRQYRHIILTGGAMRDLRVEVEKALKHGSIYPVDPDPNSIITANMRGGRVIVLAALIRDGKLPKEYQNAYRQA